MKTLFKHRCEKCGIKTKEIFPMGINYVWKNGSINIKNCIHIRLCKDCYDSYKDEIWRY